MRGHVSARCCSRCRRHDVKGTKSIDGTREDGGARREDRLGLEDLRYWLRKWLRQDYCRLRDGVGLSQGWSRIDWWDGRLMGGRRGHGQAERCDAWG